MKVDKDFLLKLAQDLDTVMELLKFRVADRQIIGAAKWTIDDLRKSIDPSNISGHVQEKK